MQCLTETSAGVFQVTSPQPTQYTTCTSILATPAEIAVNPDGVAYDYTAAAAMFTFAFSGVLSLWFVSKNIGIIIDAVRRW